MEICPNCLQEFDGEEGCLAPLPGEDCLEGYCCIPCAIELQMGA